MAEFGHTPKLNSQAGRDHWGRVFSMAPAGAGIHGGGVHGTFGTQAAEPLHDPVRPGDHPATVFA